MSALVVSALTRSFGDLTVLRGVDLDVPGGITAVLGSSGCGKTTLLRLVAGFLTPDGGTISIGGRTVAAAGVRVPARFRHVGYVPQEGALFPHLDVAQNIAFGLSRRDRRGPRVSRMLDLVELPAGYAKRFPHELSGGQQQRVALARALAPEPSLVLLDEPFSSLDSALREETGRAVANALRSSGATAVLVTHDRGEAMSLADRVAVMSAGRILQVAPPAELYLFPVDVEVASFVTDAVLVAAIVSAGIARSVLGDLEVVGQGTSGRCVLAVRQEQIILGSATGRPTGVPADGVEAAVMEVTFFGQHATVRAVVTVPGEDPVKVTTRVLTATAPEPGDRVSLRVNGPVRAFRAQGGCDTEPDAEAVTSPPR